MKKTTIVCLCLICLVVLILLSGFGLYLHSQYCLKHFFEDWTSESDQKMLQVSYSDRLYDKNQNFLFDIGEILNVEQGNGFVEEVYCVRNNRIYFCYSTSTHSLQYEEWHIASLSLGGEDFQEHFHNMEDPIRDGKHLYEKLSYAYREDHSIGGLYHNGKIFLRTQTKNFAYDIDTDTVTEVENLPTLKYTFTVSEDNQQLLIENTKTNENRTVTLQSMAKINAYAEQLLDIHSDDAFDYFFANAVSVDEEIYIICEVVGFAYIFSLMFEYDFANNEVHFVSLLMGGDATIDNYSIVPFFD